MGGCARQISLRRLRFLIRRRPLGDPQVAESREYPGGNLHWIEWLADSSIQPRRALDSQTDFGANGWPTSAFLKPAPIAATSEFHELTRILSSSGVPTRLRFPPNV